MNRLTYPCLLASLLLTACGGGADQAASSTVESPSLQEASIVSASDNTSLAGRSAAALANTPAVERSANMQADLQANPQANTQTNSQTNTQAETPAGSTETATATTTTTATAPATTAVTIPSTTTTAPTLPANTTCGLANFQQEFIARVNQARASARLCGTTLYPAVAPLGWNARIFADAAAHSTDMAVNNYFSHTGLNGSTAGSRLTAAGYSWSTYGENIAWGQSGIASVMDSWLNSSGHCANIMQARVTEFAVACVRNSSGRPYWTMVLARPR